MPHPGIVPISKRVHWVESDTRQGLVRARVAGEHRIEVDQGRAHFANREPHPDLGVALFENAVKRRAGAGSVYVDFHLIERRHRRVETRPARRLFGRGGEALFHQ